MTTTTTLISSITPREKAWSVRSKTVAQSAYGCNTSITDQWRIPTARSGLREMHIILALRIWKRETFGFRSRMCQIVLSIPSPGSLSTLVNHSPTEASHIRHTLTLETAVDYFENYIDPTAKSRNDTLRTCSKWISSCLRDHQSCCTIRQRSAQLNLPRPNRLLQLLHPQRQIVRLITVRDDQDYSYITLSHRWGDTRQEGPEPHRLSRLARGPGMYSVAGLEAGVPVSTLPKTFRDALEIIGHCGYEYLWIDSLCILQDKDANGNNPDWEAEAPNVGGIYARAVLNIAATENKDSEGGLFSGRQGIRVPFFWDQRSLSSVFANWLAFESTLRVGSMEAIEGNYWGGGSCARSWLPGAGSLRSCSLRLPTCSVRRTRCSGHVLGAAVQKSSPWTSRPTPQ